MITFINYADGYPFEKYRKVNSWSAKHLGHVNRVVEYSRKDIPEAYILRFKDTFNNKRGAGLWLWKPYIINDALKKLPEDDWLFYCDSGAMVLRNISYLVKCAEDNKTYIMLFEQPLLNKEFTKHETFVGMNVEDYDENQLLAGFILVKKCAESTRFFNEWKESCEHLDWLSPEHFHPEIEENSFYYSHREDQSVLTLLAIKYKLPVFRDCSDFGEWPHQYFSTHYSYNPKQYPNSTYPTIILSSRKGNPYKCYIRYYLKKVAYSLGFIDPKKVLEKKRRRGD